MQVKIISMHVTKHIEEDSNRFIMTQIILLKSSKIKNVIDWRCINTFHQIISTPIPNALQFKTIPDTAI